MRACEFLIELDNPEEDAKYFLVGNYFSKGPFNTKDEAHDEYDFLCDVDPKGMASSHLRIVDQFGNEIEDLNPQLLADKSRVELNPNKRHDTLDESHGYHFGFQGEEVPKGLDSVAETQTYRNPHIGDTDEQVFFDILMKNGQQYTVRKQEVPDFMKKHGNKVKAFDKRPVRFLKNKE